jgi:hypothetical protein
MQVAIIFTSSSCKQLLAQCKQAVIHALQASIQFWYLALFMANGLVSSTVQKKYANSYASLIKGHDTIWQ